jgi:hypothetical protein
VLQWTRTHVAADAHRRRRIVEKNGGLLVGTYARAYQYRGVSGRVETLIVTTCAHPDTVWFDSCV